jgi:hypothetical protein
MKTVIFHTETAVLKFSAAEIAAILNLKRDGYRTKEASEIQDYLESQSSDLIKLPSRFSYFGFIALDLLRDGKGSAFCKTCQMEYSSTVLKSGSIGFGKNPLKVKMEKKGGIIRNLFGKKQRMGMMGGERYLCPKWHELIFVITWIT